MTRILFDINFVRGPAFILPTLFCFLVLSIWVYQDSLFLPSHDADAVYFEILATNIANSNEFSGALSTEVISLFKDTKIFNALQRGPGTYAEEMHSLGIDGRNAYRPPLFPVLLSLLYKGFGPSFLWAKLLNLISIAIGISLLISAANSIEGLKLAWIVGVLAIFDPLNVLFSSLALSEALSFMGLAILVKLFLLGFQFSNRPALMGTLLGFLGLIRHVFYLWVPILLLVLYPGCRKALKVSVMVLLVLMPWAIRNSVHLKCFAPLGSQGGVHLGMVYREGAVDRSGNWNAQTHHAFIDEASDLPTEGREKLLMQKGQQNFQDWMKVNSVIFPLLFMKRVFSLWWYDTLEHQKILVILSLFGLCWAVKEPWCRPLVALCIAHSITIGLMGNVSVGQGELDGRYLYSLHPVLLLLSAFGISNLCHSLSALIRHGKDISMDSITTHGPNYR